MKTNYKPKNSLEKFGMKVYPPTKDSHILRNLEAGYFFPGQKKTSKLLKFGGRVYSALVENFSQTFFVGGMVRDFLLGREISDIDIATEGRPEQIIPLLKSAHILFDDRIKNLGVITAREGDMRVEIATFRREEYDDSRYPKVEFVKNPKVDSRRRDFKMNSLYLSPKNQVIRSYQGGFADLSCSLISFIGEPKKRIVEDPLRIIRALRFALDLNFEIEPATKRSIKKHFDEIKKLTPSRLQKEIKKIKSQKNKKIVQEVINSPKILDKYFK